MGDWAPRPEPRWVPSNARIDIAVAQPARLDDYVVGGSHHFTVDREISDRIAALTPGGTQEVRATVAAANDFWRRVVTYLVSEGGIHQFLSCGTRASGTFRFHDVAQSIESRARFVYMVIDPTVLARGHDLRRGTAEGAVDVISARLKDTRSILQKASPTLDFVKPVALLFPASLPYVRRTETAHRIVDELAGGLSPGSYLAISHHASDIRADELAAAWRCRDELAEQGRMLGMVRRSQAEVGAFFEGHELVEPGVVPLSEWRPEPPADAGLLVPAHGGVARKSGYESRQTWPQ